MMKRIIALLVALAWICAGLGALAEVDINDEDTNFRMAEAWKNAIDTLIADCVCPAGIDYSSEESYTNALSGIAAFEREEIKHEGYTQVFENIAISSSGGKADVDIWWHKNEPGYQPDYPDEDRVIATFSCYDDGESQELYRYYAILPQKLSHCEPVYETLFSSYGVTQEMVDWYRAADSSFGRSEVAWEYDGVYYRIIDLEETQVWFRGGDIDIQLYADENNGYRLWSVGYFGHPSFYQDAARHGGN